MGRLFALLIALLGAASLSQGPEFAQQYMQRLGGAVDELRSFVVRFNSDVDAAGITRADALEAYAQSGEFLSLQGVRIEDTIERFERLDAHQQELRQAGDYARTWLILREHDLPLLRAAADDYRPALPLTMAGAVHAGAGFLIFWAVGILLAGLLGALLRPVFGPRRRHA